jgi:pimeloyl-ACP methyl ester carboxylesterase
VGGEENQENGTRFAAGVDGAAFDSGGSRLLGAFYRGAGESPRPTALLLHGLPGIEKHLDLAYRLRDLGWNCLAFHFRGCWGSGGTYSLPGLAADTRAALDWAVRQPSVDPERIALIGGSTGGYTALLAGADAPGVRAVVALCPFIDPGEFEFPVAMAEEFAGMLTGISGQDLLDQWSRLEPLAGRFPALAEKAVLLATGDRDDLVPPGHFAAFAAALPDLQWARHPEGDHSFSTCRPWLVETVAEWLVAQLGR